MSLKSVAAKLFASAVARKRAKWLSRPYDAQNRVLASLLDQGGNTQFGRDHNFDTVTSHDRFVKQVPIRDYEALKPYIEQMVAGKENILWPGRPVYFAKTSGTTSGAKYIPITKESMRYQVKASRNAILAYIHETGNAGFVDGKWIFLQGSPELNEKNGIKLGRLSGISAHYVPNYLQKNRLPSWKTNCISDWETKVEAIIDETMHENMTLIAGIPSWVQMYFERLRDRLNEPIGTIFPNFQLFIYGGVNYEPYRAKFENLIGRKVDSIELFPASEGFFAYQDSQTEKGMLLLLDHGIFYEFINVDAFTQPNPKRHTLQDVEVGVNYVMIISTNAGLWAYNLGDTIQFVSLDPHRIIVSGRIKHFISAFGEHVIAKEVEEAIQKAIQATGARINEFTVAPQVEPANGELPYHEWLIEFERSPNQMETFVDILDASLQQQNSYYFDLIEGRVLQKLKITEIEPGGFQSYMKAVGKLGGQNKVQRLANDRSVADTLSRYAKA